MGRVLADRIDDVAAELSGAPTAAGEGLVQDDEMLRLESYCLQADIISLDLEFDVIRGTAASPPGVPERGRAKLAGGI